MGQRFKFMVSHFKFNQSPICGVIFLVNHLSCGYINSDITSPDQYICHLLPGMIVGTHLDKVSQFRWVIGAAHIQKWMYKLHELSQDVILFIHVYAQLCLCECLCIVLFN